MTILSPLYSYLPHRMITIVQDNEPIRHEFAFCAKEGCINFIPLMQQDVNMLKKEWNLSAKYNIGKKVEAKDNTENASTEV